MPDATAASTESLWKDSTFRRQVLATFIGAVAAFAFGFVGIVYQAHAQAEMQRKQFLLDRRISTLKDFVAALNGDGNLCTQCDRLERQLGVAISHPDSTQALSGVVRQGFELNEAYQRYVAGLRAQTLILGTVFGVHGLPTPDIPDFPDLQPKDLTGINQKKLRSAILEDERGALEEMQQWRTGLIKYIKAYYEILDVLESQLDVS